MWEFLSIQILRFRRPLLIALVLLTGFMAWHATKIHIAYDFAKVVPEDNPIWINYKGFKEEYGEEGNVLVIATKSPEIFKLDFFRGWFQLGQDIEKINGIKEALSIPTTYTIGKDTVNQRFVVKPLFQRIPTTQSELDSMEQEFLKLKFYEGVIFNSESSTTLMAVSLARAQLDSKERLDIVDDIEALVDQFEEEYDTELHMSGLPYIRSYTASTVSSELTLFLALALLILAIILYILFRNFMAVLLPILVVVIGAIWAVGTMSLLGYRITILTGLLPTLIVVIGIPNCIYLTNKYHAEFKKHGNKQKALMRMIAKIGNTTLYTNLTTAIGFGVFYFANTKVLEEFGIVAFLGIIEMFLLSVVTLPLIFSYLKRPKTKHTVHLDRKVLNWVLTRFEIWSMKHRVIVMTVTGIIVVLAAVGMLRLHSEGFILDDVPKNSKVYQDLKFFEKEFKGVMPFEMLVTPKDSTPINIQFIRKINAAQDTLTQFPEFSRPMSIAEAFKFAMQAYYNDNPNQYKLPSDFILTGDPVLRQYLNHIDEANSMDLKFVGDDNRTARISVQVADVGSEKMPLLMAKVKPEIEKVFPKEEYDVIYTGTSLIALEGYRYIINGLLFSVALAFGLIALIMAYLFRSLKMLVISLIPNIIPLVVTASIMGYFNIPLKPSTVLVFSVAFGISVDYTIHFLAKYRQELRRHSWDISKTVLVSLKETGVSMVYTSIILLFGFGVFTFSNFEGTVNLGRLTSITLIVAMLSNLVLLPALLLIFEKYSGQRALISTENDEHTKILMENEAN